MHIHLRLAKLGRVFNMERFKYVFKYIDSICWINIDNAHQFSNHVASRDEDNPVLNLSSLICGNQIKD